MADEEVPAHRLVFGRERMKRREPRSRWRRPRATRVAAGLEHEHGVSRFGEPRGDGATTRARADDDVVGEIPSRWRRCRGSSGLATRPGSRPLQPAAARRRACADAAASNGTRSEPRNRAGSRQNVFRNAISAFLSASLKPGSSLKYDVPK